MASIFSKPSIDTANCDNAQTLREKIRSRDANIAILGLGYVGLPLAQRFSHEGFRVSGLDPDNAKIAHIEKGRSYLTSISHPEMRQLLGTGFTASSNPDVLKDADIAIICVPTPLGRHHEPDLRFIRDATLSIAPYISQGTLVVLESTTYPGTTEEVVVPLLEQHNPLCLRVIRKAKQHGFYVGYSPEREDPGNTGIHRRDVPKVVSGIGPDALALVAELYQTIFDDTVPVSSPETAEMTKLLENTYRCVNIALVNELKQLCGRMNIDIYEVIEAAKTKPFGFQAFYPGPGLGGHCIPIDPFYLSWRARQYDFTTKFIELAGEINRSMPAFIVTCLMEALNQNSIALRQAKILILGIAYKRDIDDVRESPAFTIMDRLLSLGAAVYFHDPFCTTVAEYRHGEMIASSVSMEGIASYDCVVICTDHSSFDYGDIIRDARLVIDTRNATGGSRAPNIVRC